MAPRSMSVTLPKKLNSPVISGKLTGGIVTTLAPPATSTETETPESTFPSSGVICVVPFSVMLTSFTCSGFPGTDASTVTPVKT